MITAPLLTDAAVGFLAGRAVHVRASRRHGCCGGAAWLPTAEVGTLEPSEETDRFEVSGVTVHVDRRLHLPSGRWTIDVEGFARWRRLVVLGLDLAPVIDTATGGNGNAGGSS